MLKISTMVVLTVPVSILNPNPMYLPLPLAVLYDMVITCSKSMDQPGKVANPARGQLNRENEHSPCPRSHLRIWSRETGSTVPPCVSLLFSLLRLYVTHLAVTKVTCNVKYKHVLNRWHDKKSLGTSCITKMYHSPPIIIS